MALPVELLVYIASCMPRRYLWALASVSLYVHDAITSVLHASYVLDQDNAERHLRTLLLRVTTSSGLHVRYPAAYALRHLTVSVTLSKDARTIMPLLQNVLVHANNLLFLQIRTASFVETEAAAAFIGMKCTMPRSQSIIQANNREDVRPDMSSLQCLRVSGARVLTWFRSMDNLTKLVVDGDTEFEAVAETLCRFGSAKGLESLVVSAKTAARRTFIQTLARTCPRLRHLGACHMHIHGEDYAVKAFAGVYNVRSPRVVGF